MGRKAKSLTWYLLQTTLNGASTSIVGRQPPHAELL